MASHRQRLVQGLDALAAGYSLLVVAISLMIVIALVDPIWQQLGMSVPGEPTTRIDFTQVVDSAFYVRNIELGFRWGVENHLSIWFHPAAVWLSTLVPTAIPANVRFWLVSVISALIAIYLLHRYISQVHNVRVNPKLLLAIPLLPGGIGMATGNTEFLCLLFCTLLLSSVIRGDSWWHQLVWGLLAILTKPNAIYVVPSLAVYLIYSIQQRDRTLLIRSLIGISAVMIGWFIWIAAVDILSNEPGAYWAARDVATVPLSAGPLTFLQRMARILLHSNDGAEKLKFITALSIPMVYAALLLHLRGVDDLHKLSILAGLISMVALVFLSNNPNKIIVYATTHPGFLAISILYIKQTFFRKNIVGSSSGISQFIRITNGIVFVFFCISMLVFYILGTPLGWYY